MSDRTPDSDKPLLPWWMVAVVILFSISMIPSEVFGAILIPWHPLAVVFPFPFVVLAAPVVLLREWLGIEFLPGV